MNEHNVLVQVDRSIALDALWDFTTYGLDYGDCGTPRCMIGWVGFHSGLTELDQIDGATPTPEVYTAALAALRDATPGWVRTEVDAMHEARLDGLRGWRGMMALAQQVEDSACVLRDDLLTLRGWVKDAVLATAPTKCSRGGTHAWPRTPERDGVECLKCGIAPVAV